MSKRIALFDLDGTLTPARQPISDEMVAFLAKLRTITQVAIISGSDEAKVNWQMNGKGHEMCDYLFVENGVVAYQDGKLFSSESISKHLGEKPLKELINFCLKYIADLDIPIKRGTFIEYRQAMLNISPIGRNCSTAERLEFNEQDKVVREREREIERQ
eukprot:GHVU01228784.1.p1 GENE.GHVU01228784.1~~GHVU01228784.1.p1  ORF type:complete len:159 (+),score=25.97 GHVU01228784.1:227-703(+)